MIITKKWLEKHAIAYGAWHKNQMDAIGVSWPQKKGWKESVIGKEITLENQMIFERGGWKGVTLSKSVHSILNSIESKKIKPSR